MFGRRKKCIVEVHGDTLEEYPKERTLWVERAEDLYGTASMNMPFCVLDRQDWLRGVEV